MLGYKNKNQLLISFLLVGFFVGVIYENVVAKNQVITTELFLKSNLQRYLQTDVIAEKYSWYVIKERLFILLVLGVLSCIKWKKIFVAICLFVIGYCTGVFCVAAILQLGIKGVLICVAGALPQALFYGVAYGMLFVYWFWFPERKWNRTKTISLVALLIVGILLEIYVNPIVVKFVIRFL